MTDLKSFQFGLALGLSGKPLPLTKKTPIGYSYNGVVLPELPEWDRESYPYAYLVRRVVGNEVNNLLLSSTPLKAVNASGSLVVGIITGKEMYVDVDGEWQSTDVGSTYYQCLWSNTDVYYSDAVDELAGTLYLAASEPIPVYE